MKLARKVDYRKRRRGEYPPIEEFADAYVKMLNGDPKPLEEYAAKVTAVKQRHPKK